MRTLPRALMHLFLAPMALLIARAAALGASTEADFKRAYAAAEAAEKQAGSLRNQWTVSETSLAEARKAATEGDFARAIAAAKEAEALARASIFQAVREKEAWKNLEIR
jgi:hypothetical protein